MKPDEHDLQVVQK